MIARDQSIAVKLHAHRPAGDRSSRLLILFMSRIIHRGLDHRCSRLKRS
jgi:hypothetical protein